MVNLGDVFSIDLIISFICVKIFLKFKPLHLNNLCRGQRHVRLVNNFRTFTVMSDKSIVLENRKETTQVLLDGLFKSKAH